jgi:hypothetical protein
MARPLILSLDGQETAVSILKVDRERLYGDIEIEAFDEKGKPASIKVLAADGRTLLDKGGTALATIDEDGNSVSRAQFRPVDMNGDPIETVPSSFGQTNILERASPDEYLSQVVKSVYLLQPAEGSDLDYLVDHLSAGQMFRFQFSYRGGVEHDSAFVVGNDKADAFMVVGRDAALQFVRLNQAAVLDSTEEMEISGEELDFELL